MKGPHQAQASFFSYSSDYFLILDWDGQIRDMNQNWENLTDYNRADWYLKHIYDYIHPDEHTHFRGYLAQLKETNKSVDCELRVKKKNGSYTWMRWCLHFDLKSRAVCVVARPARASDDPDRKTAATTSARSNENRFHTILNENHIGIALGDFSGKFVDANPFFCKLLGFTREQMLGKVLSEITHAEDYNQEFKILKALEMGVINHYSTEKRYVRKDGTSLWCHVLLRVEEDPQTQQKTLVRIVEDISEKVAAKERLNRLTHVFPGTLFQFVRTKEGKSYFDFVSEGSLELLGLPNDAIVQDVNVLYGQIHSQDVEEFHRSLTNSSLKLAPWHWSGRVQVPGERIRWIQGIAHPHQGDGGKIIWDGVFLDVSALKEQELIIREQSKRISNSMTMAMLWELFNGIVGELNGPASGILGKAQYILQQTQTGSLSQPKAKEAAEKIESLGRQLTRTIKGYKFIGRDGSKDPLETRSLRSIAEETIELCQSRLRDKQVEVKWDPFCEAALECRPVQIAHVLLSLIHNSIDAVESLPSKWIKFGCVEQGENLVFTITDSGTGVPAQVVDKIMLPFFTTKVSGQHSGLGLSSAKGIIEAHSGRLILDRESSFTKFSITLPKRQRKSIKVA